MLDNHVNVLDVDKAVAQRARHLRINLRNHQIGGLGCRAHGLHRDAQGAETKAVGWGDLYQGHIQRHAPTAEQLGNL